MSWDLLRHQQEWRDKSIGYRIEEPESYPCLMRVIDTGKQLWHSEGKEMKAVYVYLSDAERLLTCHKWSFKDLEDALLNEEEQSNEER